MPLENYKAKKDKDFALRGKLRRVREGQDSSFGDPPHQSIGSYGKMNAAAAQRADPKYSGIKTQTEKRQFALRQI
jgi:hypothetical protein